MESPNELTVNSSETESFDDLSEKDRAFAVRWLTNGYDHHEAAVHVGYARKGALKHLRKPLVQRFIKHLRTMEERASLISKDFVEQKYMEVLPKLMGEEDVPIYDHKEGVTVNAKKFHSAEVVSVLRDLGKAAGYVAPDGPRTAPVNVTVDLGGFTGQPTVIIEQPGEESEDDD